MNNSFKSENKGIYRSSKKIIIGNIILLVSSYPKKRIVEKTLIAYTIAIIPIAFILAFKVSLWFSTK